MLSVYGRVKQLNVGALGAQPSRLEGCPPVLTGGVFGESSGSAS